MLDEMALRRDGWSEGHEVTLADGQAWTFPRPWLRFFPMRDSSGAFVAGAARSYGKDHQAQLDAMDACGDDFDGDLQRLSIRFGMAAHLLLANYILTDDDLMTLLMIDPEDEGTTERWAEINRVLRGSVPKPSAAGSVAS